MPVGKSRSSETTIRSTGFDFVEGRQRLHCFAAEVHIGLRFDHEDTLLADPAAGDFGFVLAFVEGQVVHSRQLIHDLEAYIMAIVLVARAGIPQADDHLHGLGRWRRLLGEKSGKTFKQGHGSRVDIRYWILEYSVPR